MNPTDPKVHAAAVGAGAGAIIATFVLWLLDLGLWNGDAPPDVPAPVAAMVTLVVASALSWVAGYVKRTPLDTLVERTQADPQVTKVHAFKADGSVVATGSGTLPDAPIPPGPNEFGHVTGSLLGIMVLIAAAVSVIVWLLLRAV
jgi:hypothetical protein